MIEFSSDAAVSGGIVSAVLLWLVRLLLGHQFAELLRTQRETVERLQSIDRRLAYLEGRESREQRDQHPQ